MPIIPAYEDSVKIVMIGSSCCRSEFDSDYPNRLNGIIGRDEFEKSITNINKTITSTHRIICACIIFIFTIGGFIIFIVSTTQISNLKIENFAMLGVGIFMFFVGILSMIFGCCIVELVLAHRMRPTIDNESKQYSTRSPTPCVWRLVSKTACIGGPRNGRIIVIHHIIIDIGSAVSTRNQSVPYEYNQPTPFISQQNNTDLPPPYNSVVTSEFCRQCKMSRQYSTAKFCTSCRYQFDT